MGIFEKFQIRRKRIVFNKSFRVVRTWVPLAVSIYILIHNPNQALSLESISYNGTLMQEILRSPEGRAILLAAENQCKIELALDRLRNGTGKVKYLYYGLFPVGFLVGFLIKKLRFSHHK